MTRFWRILQLTSLALVFLVTSGVGYFLIEWCSDGRVRRWRNAPFSGSVADESIAIELAALPIVLGVLSCWGLIRLFRFRSVQNEINDTLKPVLEVVAGYGRFVLVGVALVHLLIGHGWAAAAHLVAAAVLFVVFFYQNRPTSHTGLDLK